MNAEQTMTIVRFAQIVAAYGADARVWPEGEREAALAFCSSDDDAKRLRADAAALDAALAQSETPVAGRALEDRIMSGFHQIRRARGAPGKRWIGAGALAASLVLGVTAAWVVLRPHHQVDLSDPAAWEVLGDDLEFGAKREQ